MPTTTATECLSSLGRIVFIFAHTSLAVVDLPLPGTPAMPTMYLAVNVKRLLHDNSRRKASASLAYGCAPYLRSEYVNSEASNSLSAKFV